MSLTQWLCGLGYGHDYVLALPLRAGENCWTWVLCCQRCGRWDECGATDRMVELLKEAAGE